MPSLMIELLSLWNLLKSRIDFFSKLLLVMVFYHSNRNGATTVGYLVLSLAPGSWFGRRNGHSDNNATLDPGSATVSVDFLCVPVMSAPGTHSQGMVF